MAKVFIDGRAGTTGLRIADRLVNRPELELLSISDDLRKDPAAKAAVFDEADVVFLCLPDAAARESVALVSNPDTVVIDTSAAHRTDPQWAYGFAELAGHSVAIASSKRIANPGCHATGFIALIAPLIASGTLAPDTLLSCLSLTGYSGGGKAMIADYTEHHDDPLYAAPRMYGLNQAHKHLPEMLNETGLTQAPTFTPVVGNFYSGMEVVVPLHAANLQAAPADLTDLFREYYGSGLVSVVDDDGLLSAASLAGRDDLVISLHGNEDRVLLVARFDNLGKGASGAAIQNMNIALGLDPIAGLQTKGE